MKVNKQSIIYQTKNYFDSLFKKIIKKKKLSSVNNRLIPSDMKTKQSYLDIGGQKHIIKMSHLFFLLYYFTILCEKYKLTTTLFGMNLIGCYEDKTILFWEDNIEIIIHLDSLFFFISKTKKILKIDNIIFIIQTFRFDNKIYFKFFSKDNPNIYITLLNIDIVKDTISKVTWNHILNTKNYSLHPFGLIYIQVLKQKYGIQLLNQIYKHKWKIKCHPSLYYWIMKLDTKHCVFTNTTLFTLNRGTLYEQIFRNIALSMCVKKHDLLCQYSHKPFTDKLGIPLYIGTKLFKETIILSEENFNYILNIDKKLFRSNLNPMYNYFKTKLISSLVYQYILDNIDIIINQNPYQKRYKQNKNILIHIDNSLDNITYNDYKSIIDSLPYRGSIYILTNIKEHPIICKLKTEYPLQLINIKDNIKLIQFCSTCEYIILSNSMLSTLIGYVSFYSYIFYFIDKSKKINNQHQTFRNKISKWFAIQLK